jgi:hypothetical protein
VSDLFLLLAGSVLVLHFLFNIWVVCGAFVTAGRPTLERLHILSLFYGVVMENVSWPCPLTLLQKRFLVKAGAIPYQGDFILHYLRAVVAPAFPLGLLHWGAIGLFLVNMAVYVRRYASMHHHAYHH